MEIHLETIPQKTELSREEAAKQIGVRLANIALAHKNKELTLRKHVDPQIAEKVRKILPNDPGKSELSYAKQRDILFNETIKQLSISLGYDDNQKAIISVLEVLPYQKKALELIQLEKSAKTFKPLKNVLPSLYSKFFTNKIAAISNELGLTRN